MGLPGTKCPQGGERPVGARPQLLVDRAVVRGYRVRLSHQLLRHQRVTQAGGTWAGCEADGHRPRRLQGWVRRPLPLPHSPPPGVGIAEGLQGILTRSGVLVQPQPLSWLVVGPNGQSYRFLAYKPGLRKSALPLSQGCCENPRKVCERAPDTAA